MEKKKEKENEIKKDKIDREEEWKKEEMEEWRIFCKEDVNRRKKDRQNKYETKKKIQHS